MPILSRLKIVYISQRKRFCEQYIFESLAAKHQFNF